MLFGDGQRGRGGGGVEFDTILPRCFCILEKNTGTFFNTQRVDMPNFSRFGATWKIATKVIVIWGRLARSHSIANHLLDTLELNLRLCVLQTCLVMQSEQIRVVPLKEDFLSLQAKENITAGSFLTDLWGPEFDKATSHTVQVTENKHVEPQGGMKFTNHSCLPNARFIFSNYHPSHSSNLQDGHSIWWHMVACRDIKEGEDITFDYNTTEYEMDAPFSCGCGTQKCLGDVRGFRFLSDEEKKERLAYLSPVIKELHSMQA